MNEFDRYGRYIEDPCYGCDEQDCSQCPREERIRIMSEL